MNTHAGLKGRYVIEHWRGGKLINTYEFPNGLTTQGRDTLLNIMFDTATQITAWYAGMVDSSGYTALAGTDTYQNINQAGNQWTEFTSYTDGNNGDNASTRPAWSPAGATGQAIANGSPMIYNITSPGTVVGLFAVGGIVNAKNKNDHAAGGVLWATALMTSPIPVNAADQLKVTYTVTD